MLLTIKVTPGAPKNAIKRYENNVLYVAIAAPPEKGKANRELIRFLAEKFNLSPNEIEIVSGASSKIKHVKLPLNKLPI